MTVRRKRLEPLADALAEYLKSSGIAEAAEARRVFTEWRARVGDRIADVATPLRMDRDMLIVGVRSSAWLMELKLMERQLLARINADDEQGRIERIRLVLGDADGAGVPEQRGRGGHRAPTGAAANRTRPGSRGDG